MNKPAITELQKFADYFAEFQKWKLPQETEDFFMPGN